jgi:hypothetical protein
MTACWRNELPQPTRLVEFIDLDIGRPLTGEVWPTCTKERPWRTRILLDIMTALP